MVCEREDSAEKAAKSVGGGAASDCIIGPFGKEGRLRRSATEPEAKLSFGENVALEFCQRQIGSYTRRIAFVSVICRPPFFFTSFLFLNHRSVVYFSV